MEERSSPYLVSAQPGFTPVIGRLVAMLAYARRTTLQTVQGLSVAQLDHVQDAESNSIGALLLHVAGVEVAYQCATFAERGLTEAEQDRWEPALALGSRGREAIRGHTLAHYVAVLQEVRAHTLRELGQRDDAWLEVTTPFAGGHVANNHFKWFHVCEDEINHRGQMRWLRRRVPAG
jgi:uncharacterized damage-inducible protein DinB